MSYLCRCGNLLSYRKALEIREKSGFSRAYRPLFNRIRRVSVGFSAEFSTSTREWKISLIQEYFFQPPNIGLSFFHRLFHNLWKTHLRYILVLSSPSRFFRTSDDISTTKPRHFCFSTLSYRQNAVKTRDPRGFFPLFYGKNQFFCFSTRVFHSMWENLWKTPVDKFRQNSESP